MSVALVTSIVKLIESLAPLGGEVAELAGADPKDVEKGVAIAQKVATKGDPLISEFVGNGGIHTNFAAPAIVQAPTATAPAAPPPEPGSVEERLTKLEASIAAIASMLAGLHGTDPTK